MDHETDVLSDHNVKEGTLSAEDGHGRGRRARKRSKSGTGGILDASLATALQQSQGRKRKGSLRQAALAKMRDGIAVQPPSTTGGSPIDSYASTTDEEEAMSFPQISTIGSTSFSPPNKDPTMSLPGRRSHRGERRTSVTVAPTPLNADLDEEWDYSETEWWGWVVLIVTWVVFVVGMGSCLGVWSWAWDVGETPYAPPDLEDDDTLPITGYYPALMVCTAIMSWVWVVVSWVGMKYFRHAKVMGDDA